MEKITKFVKKKYLEVNKNQFFNIRSSISYTKKIKKEKKYLKSSLFSINYQK